MKGFIKQLLREGLEEYPPIKLLKKGTIKVGLTKEYVDDDGVPYVKPKISISQTLIDRDSLDYDNYRYYYKIIFTDTEGKEKHDLNFLPDNGIPNMKFSGSRKLSEISVNIIIKNKKDNDQSYMYNINTYKIDSHDENGYLTLPDNVGRVYKNGAVKTTDDANFMRGNEKVYRRGGKGLNSSENEDLYKNWEDKMVKIGKYKGNKYGEVLAKDKNYFDWFLQNTPYYESSPESKYDIQTSFNINLYNKLKSKGIL